MTFAEYKREVIDKTPYCQGAKYAIRIGAVGGFLENNLRYGNRGLEKIEDVQKYKLIRIPEKILNEYGHYSIVDHIEAFCFRQNRYATDIILPSTIDRFWPEQFKDCVNLRHITIPRLVKIIFDDCFSGCTSLEDIYYEGSKEEWEGIRIENWDDFCLYANQNFVSYCRNENKNYKKSGGNIRVFGSARIHFNCNLD